MRTTPCTVSIDGTTVRVTGELDMASAPQLERALQEASASGDGPVVVDMAGVDFIDSSGLRALVNASRTQRVRVENPSMRVARLFDLAGVTGLFGMDR